MKRVAWIVCIVLALATVALANPPGHSSAYGKTLGEWMVGWFESWIGASDADGDRTSSTWTRRRRRPGSTTLTPNSGRGTRRRT